VKKISVCIHIEKNKDVVIVVINHWLWQIEEFPRGTCTDIFCYNIREKAEEIARIRSELKEKGLFNDIYDCAYCGFWTVVHGCTLLIHCWLTCHSLSSSLDALAIACMIISCLFTPLLAHLPHH